VRAATGLEVDSSVSRPPVSRARSFLVIAAAYVAAAVVAALVVRWSSPEAHPLRVVAFADLAATIVVFFASVAANNTSVYDPYWSVAPMAIAPWLAAQPGAAGAPLARQALVIVLVTLWGIRLTYNWARGFSGLGHEDWRYVDIRGKTGRAYWPASLFGLHLMPTVMVYLGCLALYPALTSPRPLGPLDAVAAVVTLGAVAIELVADEQLRAFRKERREGEILARGLWAFSRHPNYFGEVSFWWGLFLFALAADPGAWWAGSGAAAITALFVFASIPLLDRRSVARRPAYAEHMKRVSALVPWFPRR
jgi:steroid 5-alpha reductase family enzyme